jgi:GTPase SAR1 family protein
MVTIVVIGMTGEGKSEFVKNYIKNRNCLVMDLQNEYGPQTKYPGQVPINLSDNPNHPRARYIGGDFDEYQRIVLNKRNTICVFEEATIFLEGRTGKTMRRILTNKIFTKNVYILLFHSISAVPPRILQLTNYVVLYRTNDEPYQVERKYPSLLSSFNAIRDEWDNHKGKYKVIKIM